MPSPRSEIPSAGMINEKESLVSDGTGVVDEVAMRWAIRIFSFQDKTVLIVAFYAEEFGSENAPNLYKMIHSLRNASDDLGLEDMSRESSPKTT